jgi:hypothetical protein
LGLVALVRVLVGGWALMTRFPPRSGVRNKDQVELMLDGNRIHLFDPKSGECLLDPAPGSGRRDIRPPMKLTNEGRNGRERLPSEDADS